MSTQTKNQNAVDTDPWWVRGLVISLSLVFVALMLVLPLGVIFWEAFRKGFTAYLAVFQDRNALRAITMTMLGCWYCCPAQFGIWSGRFLGDCQISLPG